MCSRYLVVSAIVAVAGFGLNAYAQVELEGDVRLACEAVLCLSTGSPPQECNQALRHYFSITHRKLAQTIRKRKDFLNLCPASQQTAPMSDLVAAQSEAAGRCDAASLNASESRPTALAPEVFTVSNRMPAYCEAYLAHAYSDWARVLPRYVGVPERGGYWVAAKDHAAAQRAWQARIRAEDTAAAGIARR
ncbi:TrbM/KikA/MpfK family conjugal transfer protein [Comamonas endophytica]|uniref:TrbM/KikA/MpfK family conjugal transfer protein n=1 Tax=Comamonas endophytica TaxID=2949090 RepID=A0ABY6GGT1_9BURK|nr:MULTISPECIES: TrbM/KikA/MpfK family conjugal transfer protein [unclassified Acidovorax]MCD2514399.1 conjugal transfer protein TrbM [Acidovorax sp. D4N7]UYG53689.1 TrbM/KikA/MpfK family conjugal transfer protein [Acidovorax sp. 5MLIR]